MIWLGWPGLTWLTKLVFHRKSSFLSSILNLNGMAEYNTWLIIFFNLMHRRYFSFNGKYAWWLSSQQKPIVLLSTFSNMPCYQSVDWTLIFVGIIRFSDSASSVYYRRNFELIFRPFYYTHAIIIDFPTMKVRLLSVTRKTIFTVFRWPIWRCFYSTIASGY